MASSPLKKLCSEANLEEKNCSIRLEFEDGRRQIVIVTDVGESYYAQSLVAWPSRLRELADPHGMLWQKNRHTSLISFRIDRRGNAVGEAWIPKDGLEAEEFAFIIRILAKECDWMEYQLTGKDVH